MDVETTRRLNINYLANKHGRGALAELLGYDGTNYLNQLCGFFGSFGSRVARKIEIKLGLPRGWMDNTHPDLYDPDELTKTAGISRKIRDTSGSTYKFEPDTTKILQAIESLSPEAKRRIFKYIKFELTQDDSSKDTP